MKYFVPLAILVLLVGLSGCTSSAPLERATTTTTPATTSTTAATTTTAAGTTTTTGTGPTTTGTPTTSTTTTTTGPVATYTVNGTANIMGYGIAGVLVTIEGVGTTTTDPAGNFSFGSVPAGFWSMTFWQAGWTFDPASVSFVLTGNLTKNSSGEPTDWTAQKVGTAHLTAATSIDAGMFIVGKNSSVILQSTDGGTNWVTAFTNNPTSEPLIACFSMPGNTLGIINQDGSIFQSTDPTVTAWAYYFRVINTTEALVDFNAASNLTWEVVTAGGKILWSGDQGATYLDSTEAGSFVHGIQLQDPYTMVAAGNNGYVKYYDGSSWINLGPGGSENFHKALFDTNAALLVSSQGVIYKSTDNGVNWARSLTGFPATFEGVFIPGAPSFTGSIVCGSNGWVLKHK
ncbi:MAG: hypothetical protein WC529_07510 [Candidatus Margulisiibacteriota bacterium]